MNTFINYLKSVKMEMRHVVWPTKKEAINHSIIVILLSIIMAIIFYFSDLILTKLLDLLIKIF